jgi:hypothetical protein
MRIILLIFIATNYCHDGDNQSDLQEHLRALQSTFDPSQNLTSKRIIICKLAGGLGNRMQGIISCLALGIALRRTVFVDWQREIRMENGHSNGLMPCGVDELFDQTEEWNWDVEHAIGMHSAQERRDATVEAYRSQLIMSSGQAIDWASLLLCRNLTYLLKRTPILLVPAWRWMPEILQNKAFHPIFQHVITSNDGSVIPFYSSLVGLTFKPIDKIRDASRAILAYAPADARRIGLHVRVGLTTDNEVEREHFFSPAEVTDAWVNCAFASMPHEWRHDNPPRPRFWFLASDSQQGAALLR